MNNEVMNFDHEVFGKLKVIMYNDKPMFVANEVVSILKHSNPSKALKDHCKSLIKLDYNETLELKLGTKPTGLQIIPEKDVYRLIMRSKLPQAEQFQDWVMEEVLPTIRKTGGYVSDVDQMVSTFFGGCSEEVQVVAKGLLTSVKENQHKVDFFNAVAEADNNIDVNAFAKILGTGRNKLFALLREEGYIIQNSTLPYERYKTAQKWFSVIETTKNGRVYTKTLVTPKGQIELEKRLRDKLVA